LTAAAKAKRFSSVSSFIRASIENPHFRAAIDNYAALLSAMDLSQDTIAARVSSAIKGEPDKSA
jgi:hypothetical protein